MKKLFLSMIQSSIPQGSTLLLAVSGGPDSKALLELFLEEGVSISYQLHVVHFDHAYRAESEEEAQGLALYCLERNLPFHQKRLEEEIPIGNIEDFFRTKRYEFFEEVYQNIGAFALILGHHLDDQVETTLKRWFEGANFLHVAGMSLWTSIRSMQIFRPLLAFQKRDILDYLEEKGVSYYKDVTNEDPQFLRGRFRTSLVPFLEDSFGKNIKRNILRMGDLMRQMDRYLSFVTDPLLKKKKPFMGGFIFPSSIDFFKDPLEIHHYILKIAEDLKISLRQQEMDTLLSLIEKGGASKMVLSKGWEWFVERESLFVLPEKSLSFVIEEGPFSLFNWQNYVENRYVFTCPSKEYTLSCVPLSTLCIDGNSLADWYNTHKIPPFLRKKIPCFIKEGRVHHEHLTGKMLKNKAIC